MRLASIAPTSVSPSATPPAPSKSLDDAVTRLDWAHETAGTAVSEPDGISVEQLLSASDDARTAADLLASIQQPEGAGHARSAAADLMKAAFAMHHEEPDVANAVVAARGADAEQSIHDAFTAIGLDGRGE